MSRYRLALDLLHREAEALDERRWDEWLALYAEDAIFWVPSWDDDGNLVTDPTKEISLIYYANRAGLEDRVHRIRTGASSASTPLPRTCHILGNMRIIGEEIDDIAARCSFVVHIYRNGDSWSYFGWSKFKLRREGDDWRIKEKQVTILNDRLTNLLDFYCV